MKFIKQIAQRLNPDLYIPGTDSSPPPSPDLRRANSSSTLSATEKRRGISTPASNSSLRKKTNSLFLSRGSNIQDFATWADSDSPVQSSSASTSATTPTPSLPPPRIIRIPATRDSSPGLVSSSSATSLSKSRKRISKKPSTHTSTTSTQQRRVPATLEPTDPLPIATAMSSVRDSDKSLPYFPLAGQAKDGFSNAEEATATCYCGTVQLAFPVEGPGLVSTFVCNCTDCRKITASMFASNFTVRDSHLRHLRGRPNLSTYGQVATIASGHTMTNYFCKTCGTLMYRIGDAFPGCSILRLGTVDDFNLVETKLKPTRELFVKDRVSWFSGVQGDEVKRFQAML